MYFKEDDKEIDFKILFSKQCCQVDVEKKFSENIGNLGFKNIKNFTFICYGLFWLIIFYISE